MYSEKRRDFADVEAIALLQQIRHVAGKLEGKLQTLVLQSQSGKGEEHEKERSTLCHRRAPKGCKLH